MNDVNNRQSVAPFDPSRRRLLVGVVTAFTASLIPWAMAQTVPDQEQGEFMALSAIIAGRPSLNAELSDLYFEALTRADPQFSAGVSKVLVLIDQHRIEPLQLQSMLDEHYPDLAPIPRKIASAWFLGIAGEGEHRQSFAYADALNAVLVSDVLKPPSYCYGAYGSWAQKPI